jgi:hypothetical protein
MSSKKQARPSIPEVLGYVYEPTQNGWDNNEVLVAFANRLKEINIRYKKIKELITTDVYNKLYGDFSTLIEKQRSVILDEENETLLKKIEDRLSDIEKSNGINGGGRYHNNTTMTMKDIKELCKDNQIKLSRVVNDKRVVYKKKELLTKLKRKKVI